MKHDRIFEYKAHWLAKRGESPYWQIMWRIPGSRRVHRKSTGTSNINAAKDALISFAGGFPHVQITEPDWLKFDAAIYFYLQHKKDIPSYPTTMLCAATLLNFAREHDLEYVSQFTIDYQKVFIQLRKKEVRERGYRGSNGTINRELRVLNAAFKFCQKHGRIRNTPYVELLREPPPRDNILTVDECKRLLAACHAPHIRLFVMIAMHTLQRTGAILALRVEQINLEANRIDFHPKGELISNKRKPVVPITDTLRPELERAIHESTTGHIIEYYGAPVDSVKRAFNSAVQRAGLKNVSPHDLRHTGATLLAAAGVPMRQIAGMLGHSHTRTTERYAKHRPEYLSDATSKLNVLFD